MTCGSNNAIICLVKVMSIKIMHKALKSLQNRETKTYANSDEG